MKAFGILWVCCLHTIFVQAQYDSLVVDDVQRYYLLHLPADYSPDRSYALVVALHGGFGSGEGLEVQSGLSDRADLESFIVVYPEGVKGNFGIRTWNGGACCGYAVNRNIDDVGFLDTLMDRLISDYPIDTLQLYITGMSNGGFMAYRMACESSRRIAAIAPVAATMNTPCTPDADVAIIQFHSYLDENIPYLGGIGNGVSKHYNPPLDSVLNVWAGFNSCTSSKDTLYDGEDYDYFLWSECDCQADIAWYMTHDGGHSWPGGNRISQILDPPSKAISATDLMWEFFQQHKRCDPISSASYQEVPTLELSPNPATHILRLSHPLPEDGYIYDAQARKILFVSKGTHFIHIAVLPSGQYWLKTKNRPPKTFIKK